MNTNITCLKYKLQIMSSSKGPPSGEVYHWDPSLDSINIQKPLKRITGIIEQKHLLQLDDFKMTAVKSCTNKYRLQNF